MDQMICFGDSNTFGYDPRGFAGSRYGLETRWTGRLRAAGFHVRNLGQNGLAISDPAEAALLAARIGDPTALHTLTVMLGTNDLLRDPTLTAEETAERMGRFLKAVVTEHLPPEKLLLIAPVPLVPGEWVTDPRQLRESARLGPCYAAAAAALGVRFADAARWGVALSFDGVHFTETGHAAFAAGLLAYLDCETD